MSASWGVEATAPASEFRDQYCVRARHGLLRLGFFSSMGRTLKILIDCSKNQFGFDSI